MRIAYDHSIFTRQRYGGISRYFTHLMSEMIDLGQQPMALAPVHANAHLKAEHPGSYCGLYAGPWFYRFKGPFIYLNGLAGYLQSAIGRPDILHETYYAPFRTAPSSIPVVVTVHDMTHELFPDMFQPGDPSPALKRKAVDRADHIICISQHTQLDLENILKVSPEKITVIHHGFQPLISDPPEKMQPPYQGRPYVLFVGGRGGYKNFTGMLHAFREALPTLGDSLLVAFGDRPFQPQEQSLIRSLGLEQRVLHATGDDRRLAAHYRYARVFMFPSLYEGFGFPLLESMSLGCPVGASNTGALPEIAGDAASYFNPVDHSEMATTLSALWNDEFLRGQRIEAGFRQTAKYSWKDCARQTLRIYQGLCP